LTSTALTAVLQVLDDDVAACADIPGQGTSSPVELQNLYRHAKDAFGHHHPNHDPSKLADAVCAERGWRHGGWVDTVTRCHGLARSPVDMMALLIVDSAETRVFHGRTHIRRTALILVGRVFESSDHDNSRLYDAEHFHLLRPKKKRKRAG